MVLVEEKLLGIEILALLLIYCSKQFLTPASNIIKLFPSLTPIVLRLLRTFQNIDAFIIYNKH